MVYNKNICLFAYVVVIFMSVGCFPASFNYRFDPCVTTNTNDPQIRSFAALIRTLVDRSGWTVKDIDTKDKIILAEVHSRRAGRALIRITVDETGRSTVTTVGDIRKDAPSVDRIIDYVKLLRDDYNELRCHTEAELQDEIARYDLR
jgi:hypothetical protein